MFETISHLALTHTPHTRFVDTKICLCFIQQNVCTQRSQNKHHYNALLATHDAVVFVVAFPSPHIWWCLWPLSEATFVWVRFLRLAQRERKVSFRRVLFSHQSELERRRKSFAEHRVSSFFFEWRSLSRIIQAGFGPPSGHFSSRTQSCQVDNPRNKRWNCECSLKLGFFGHLWRTNTQGEKSPTAQSAREEC